MHDNSWVSFGLSCGDTIEQDRYWNVDTEFWGPYLLLRSSYGYLSRFQPCLRSYQIPCLADCILSGTIIIKHQTQNGP